MDRELWLKLCRAAWGAFFDVSHDCVAPRQGSGVSLPDNAERDSDLVRAARADLERDCTNFPSGPAAGLRGEALGPMPSSLDVLAGAEAGTGRSPSVPPHEGGLGDLVGDRATLADRVVKEDDGSANRLPVSHDAVGVVSPAEDRARRAWAGDRQRVPGWGFRPGATEDLLQVHPELGAPLQRMNLAGQAHPGDGGSVQSGPVPNTGPATVLGGLAGAGEGLAGKIVEALEQVPFRSAEGIGQRIGIGPSPIDRVGSYVRFTGGPEADPGDPDRAWNDLLVDRQSGLLGSPPSVPGLSAGDTPVSRRSPGGGGNWLPTDPAQYSSDRLDSSEALRDLSRAWHELTPPVASAPARSIDKTDARTTDRGEVARATDEAVQALERLSRAARETTAGLESAHGPSLPPALPPGPPFQGRYS